jgi:hypothetical protein
VTTRENGSEQEHAKWTSSCFQLPMGTFAGPGEKSVLLAKAVSESRLQSWVPGLDLADSSHLPEPSLSSRSRVSRAGLGDTFVHNMFSPPPHKKPLTILASYISTSPNVVVIWSWGLGK